MRGLAVVFRKELADNLGSSRFLIFLALVGLAGLSASYVASQSIRDTVAESPDLKFTFLLLFTAGREVLPPFTAFVSFFAPLVGLALTFDAINRERLSGTLSRLLSQPIARDAVINGKFLAALVTTGIMLLSIMLLVVGLGLRTLGIPPSFEEVLRLAAYFGISLVYIAFWMSLAMLFSILFRRIATSALAVIAVWLFLAFFMSIIAGVVADRVAPLQDDPQANTVEEALRHERVKSWIERISPLRLYDEAADTILNPGVRTLSPVLATRVAGLIPAPLPLSQTLLLVWPHLTSLIAMTVLSFAVSYVIFMRQEVKSL